MWFLDRFLSHLREGVRTDANAQASLFTGDDGTHPADASHAFGGQTMAAMTRDLICERFA